MTQEKKNVNNKIFQENSTDEDTLENILSCDENNSSKQSILNLNENLNKTEKKLKYKKSNTENTSNRQSWNTIDEYIFFESHKILGNKWSSITKFIPERSDNNLKNHFYSNLRKTLRRFTKEKLNYNDFKEKIKAYYSLIFISDKINDMEIHSSKDINQNDCNRASNNSFKSQNQANNNVNSYDNLYIYNLLNKEKICPVKLEQYLKKLCKSIFSDIYSFNIDTEYFSLENFNIDLSSKIERDNFESLIKSYIYQMIVNKSIDFLKNNSSNQNSEKLAKVEDFVKKFNKNDKNIIMNKLSLSEDEEASTLTEKLSLSHEIENYKKEIKKQPIFLNKKVERTISKIDNNYVNNFNYENNSMCINIDNKNLSCCPSNINFEPENSNNIDNPMIIILKQNMIISNLLGLYYNNNNNLNFTFNNKNNLFDYPQFAN